ncbi:MAG: aspartyl-tRNA amidotransferase [Deltaproteobacteria bacterium RBG_13_65_10]|nr:MAG: aspartyl-tRNA amidotransferase [Deltaproteobacteria bacterium RBG_13_65_10]
MSLEERLANDMKAALKGREEIRLSAIRMLRAAIKNKEIELGHALSDEEVLRAIQTMVKQRKDSIEAFKQGGRPDLVERETQEMTVLEGYLPPPLSEEEIERVVREVITATGAKTAKDIGMVMKEAMKRLGGAADGKRVNEVVRRIVA